jgi:D-erythronate 2-dehydrogenase
VRVLITGGAGFLGQALTAHLLQRGTLRGADGTDQAIDGITLADVGAAPGHARDARVTQMIGDITDRALLERAVDRQTTAVFHLAAVVSGQAEADFDLGMRVNVDGTRTLLEVCRAAGHCPRVVFASSVAVYGGDLPPVVLDTTPLTPQSSYGVQKAIGELLMSDYTRKGFIDGRSLRLPTVTVRPGKPNAAASSFASGIIREPINGETAICPVDRDTTMWVISPETAIGCFTHEFELDAAALGHERAFNLPGLSVTVAEMVAALQRVAGEEAVARISWQPDPRIVRLVDTWPGSFEPRRALALGFPRDHDFEDIVRAFAERRRQSHG